MAAIAAARKVLAAKPEGSPAHRFASAVDALGYFDERALGRAKVRHDALIRERGAAPAHAEPVDASRLHRSPGM